MPRRWLGSRSDVVPWKEVEGLDRVQITKVRVNQQFFRAMILTGYRSQCAICELPVASLLVASHIVPWAQDKSLRMNPRNGLCLCNLHDRAFDCGLITITSDYRICVDRSLKKQAPSESIANYFLKFEGQTLRLPERWLPDPKFLDIHASLARERMSTSDMSPL
jgi:putative restriction endonuclease